LDGRNGREDNGGVRRGAPAILKSYSTKDASHVAKTTYWNDLMHKLVAPLEVTPADRVGFDAQFRMDAIGPLSIRQTSSMPAKIESTVRHIAQAPEQRFFLMMPLQGSVAVAHCGRQSILEAGDFVLIDGTAPSRVEFGEPNTSIHLVLSPPDLQTRLPSPENLCGLKASRDRQFGRVVGAMLEDVWRQVESGFPQEHGPTVAKNVMDVIATAFALQHGSKFAESESVGRRRAHIKRFIEARLGEQSLSPAIVADYFGVSTRYIGMIFEREYEPISAYILRRRLEECAHQLGSVLWESHSVTDIARRWGFQDRAHFSRVFRKRFGMSPREFRRSKRNT
jgi:AraC family transcriptional regulator, positive regulator of tynA and feaB